MRRYIVAGAALPRWSRALSTKGKAPAKDLAVHRGSAVQSTKQQVGVALPRSPHATGMPSVRTEVPSGIDVRRRAIEDSLALAQSGPPLPAMERARSKLYTVLAVVLGTLGALLYAVSVDDETADMYAMTEATAALRRLRAHSRRQLLAVAQQQGEISSGRANRLIRWWSTGPADADVVIVLAAEDNENSTVWGAVHADLAAKLQAQAQQQQQRLPSVRIVTYHRVNDVSSSEVQSAGPEPVSLRLRDLQSVLAATKTSVNGSGSSSWFSSRTSKRQQLILASHNYASWGTLAAAGALATDGAAAGAGGGGGTGYSLAGVVCASPQLLHASRHMAWMQAVPAASRVPHEDEPGLLQRLLKPRAVAVDARTQSVLESALPQRQKRVALFSAMGVKGFDSADAAAERYAEDVRRAQAQLPQLSTLDWLIVEGLGPSLATATAAAAAAADKEGSSAALSPSAARAAGLPVVRVLVPAPESLPPWVHPRQRTAVTAYLLSAANQVGLFLAPEATRQWSVRLRGAVWPAAEKDASGVGRITEAEAAAVAAALAPAAPAPASDATATATPDHSSSSSQAADRWALGQALLPSVGTYDMLMLRRTLDALPAALRLQPPPPPPRRSLLYKLLQREAEATPPNFGVTLVQLPKAEDQAQQEAAAAQLQGTGIVSLPLQCPQVVAEEILHIVAACTAKQSTTSSSSTSSTSNNATTTVAAAAPVDSLLPRYRYVTA